MTSPFMQNIRSSVFRRRRTVGAARSPFTGAAQLSGLQDWRWELEFEYAPMRGAAARAFEGEIAAMGEGTGIFNAWPPTWQTSAYGQQNVGSVNGAGQTGQTLAVDGFPIFELLADKGDFVAVAMPSFAGEYHLFRLTADTGASSGTGGVNLALDAPLRTSPANNASVTFSPGNFTAGSGPRFRLLDYTHRVGLDGLHLFAIQAEEAL